MKNRFLSVMAIIIIIFLALTILTGILLMALTAPIWIIVYVVSGFNMFNYLFDILQFVTDPDKENRLFFHYWLDL